MMNTMSSGASGSTVSGGGDFIETKREEHQLCGSKHCPICGHILERNPDWVGLPAGVKFDPTDQELIEHLEAKVVGMEYSRSHPLIDEFIPTIDGEDGICYTHPEKLPGVTRDGLSRHFFHRPSKAYTTGTRKRRKIQIQIECDQLQASGSGETRWHKTGKTRPVMVNGKQKGCKKILVLYTNFGKNRKPEKNNWVMHQYHLGLHDQEKEGELVVSKIFYQTQPRQCGWSATAVAAAGERNNSGGSPCSSKEVILNKDDFNMDQIQHFKGDQFSFLHFRKTFDEGGGDIGEASTAREVGTWEKGERGQLHVTQNPHQQHQIAAAAAYHISRLSQSISAIISPPLPIHHDQTSINILDQDQQPFNVILPSDTFQHHHQQQQHHKIGERSAASGLEDLIIGCTSNYIKDESSMGNPDEAEWLKYSTFWSDPDSQDNHG